MSLLEFKSRVCSCYINSWQIQIDAERSAIGYHNKMTEKYRDKDYVTYELFKTVLLDEVSDEDEWEDLLVQQP